MVGVVAGANPDQEKLYVQPLETLAGHTWGCQLC